MVFLGNGDKMIDYNILFFIIIFIMWLYLAEKTYEDRIIYGGKNGVVSSYPNKFFSLFQFLMGMPLVIYIYYNSYVQALPMGYVISTIYFFVILYILFSVIFTGSENDE